MSRDGVHMETETWARWLQPQRWSVKRSGVTPDGYWMTALVKIQGVMCYFTWSLTLRATKTAPSVEGHNFLAGLGHDLALLRNRSNFFMNSGLYPATILLQCWVRIQKKGCFQMPNSIPIILHTNLVYFLYYLNIQRFNFLYFDYNIIALSFSSYSSLQSRSISFPSNLSYVP